MNYKKIFFLLSIFIFSNQKINAQLADSSMKILATQTRKASTQKKSFKEIKKYILPAALFTYGFVTPAVKPLNEIDFNVRKKVFYDNPHSKIKIDNYTQYMPILSVYALNLAGYKGKNNLKDATMILVTSKIISTVGAQGIKHVAKRLRPDSSARNSFPSGHTTEAFANATFLFEEYKHKNIWIGIAGYAIAATTAYLRIYNNKHWLSDVVAGAGVGIASTKIAYWLYPKFSKRLFKDKANSTVLLPSYDGGVFSMNFVRRF